MTLLVLDDDELFCRMIGSALKPHGWLVEPAVKMTEALVVLTKQRFDAVMVDLTLPDSSWQQTLARLPEIMKKAWPARVIVTTGTAPDDCEVPQGVRVLRKGEEGILSKVLSAIGDPTPL